MGQPSENNESAKEMALRLEKDVAALKKQIDVEADWNEDVSDIAVMLRAHVLERRRLRRQDLET